MWQYIRSNMKYTEDLKDYVKYDSRSGKFYRLKIDAPNLTRFLGTEATNVSSNGYGNVTIKNVKFSAHKLAWFLYYNEIPEFHIDHISGDKLDNRICNLRKSCPLSNQRNRKKNSDNSTGVNGVYMSRNKYRARIKIKGVLVNLGTYDTLEEAAEVRRLADCKYEFDDNHGRR